MDSREFEILKYIPQEEQNKIKEILHNNSFYHDWQILQLNFEDLKSIFNLGQSTLLFNLIQQEKVRIK